MNYFRMLVAIVAVCCSTAQAQNNTKQLHGEIPSPQQILGFEVGDWHVRHDQIEHYFEQLAAHSPNARLEVIGRSHEQRALLQLIISAEHNLQRLDTIRQQHLAHARNNAALPDNAPVIIWLGYSIHGNEASGANAALRVAHYLLSSDSDEVRSWLDNAIILIQPSLNPDGNDRFANWVNMHKGARAVADPQHREHNEPWPNGRPNHYWFDLNRDWLLLQHPESQARIAQFQQWLPNVVGDYHEMGTNSSFFFQPGIPSRNNPHTPERNFELTRILAGYHADAFDNKQQLYYTEESFDDFYIGKGSTYPDVQGSVGILFEQASSRGHLQDSINGKLSFKTAIENQFTASLSTIRGAVEHREALLAYQQQFYQQAKQLAKDDKVTGYILTEPTDTSRLAALVELLQRHAITVQPLQRDWQHNDRRYTAGQSFYVPLQQAQYRLIKAAFSTETDFRDNTFYDVSAWTLPHAFNISFNTVDRAPGKNVLGKQAKPKQPKMLLQPGAYAYTFDWQDQQAPVLLQALLAEQLQVRAAMSDFTASTPTGSVRLKAGAMVVPAGLQQQADWFTRLQRIQQRFDLTLYPIRSGLTPDGSDLGSHQFTPVRLPTVLLMAGEGVNSSEAGEVWYNLERLAGISPSMAEPARLRQLDLTQYSHIILPDGSYQQWQEADAEVLRRWLEQGGILWGHKRAAAWLAKHKLLQTTVWQHADISNLIPQQNLRYEDKEVLAGKQRIAGAIFEVELDLTHPLTFGFSRPALPVFKDSTLLLQPASQPFINVALYSQQPRLAGYTSAEYLPRISQSAAVIAHNVGQGRIIAMGDNPVFRGYFYGSSRLLINALYLGHSFSASTGNTAEEADEEHTH